MVPLVVVIPAMAALSLAIRSLSPIPTARSVVGWLSRLSVKVPACALTRTVCLALVPDPGIDVSSATPGRTVVIRTGPARSRPSRICSVAYALAARLPVALMLTRLLTAEKIGCRAGGSRFFSWLRSSANG